MPTKLQRVLINKRNGASAVKTANRLYKKASLNSNMSLSSAHSMSSLHRKTSSSAHPPFGSKDLRFDGKLELKEFFNKDAGPGTYEDKTNTF